MQAHPQILQMMYTRIVKLFAVKTGMSYEDALGRFYYSKLFTLISEGVADMHCLSDDYLVDELMIEYDIPLHTKKSYSAPQSQSTMVAEEVNS